MSSRNGLMRISESVLNILKSGINQRRRKYIDKSLVPHLNESDLEEKFIKGEGPGGQFVNKRNTCVFLLHKPTGLSVKVGDSREQHMNRKLARERMVHLLDNFINKEKSVESQKARILEKKLKRKVQRQKKLNEKKEAWREIMAGYSETKE